MVDYVEDPFGRIVNVHWFDPDDPPPPPDDGLLVAYCGEFEYAFQYTDTGGTYILLPIPPNEDTFIVHNPSNPNFGMQVYGRELVVQFSGIYCGAPNYTYTWVFMNSYLFDIELSWTMPQVKGIAISHTPTPAGTSKPLPTVPFISGGSPLTFTYDTRGEGSNGEYNGLPTPDSHRFDPAYGGPIQLFSFTNYGYWSRDFGFGNSVVAPGDTFRVKITGRCRTAPETRPPVITYDSPGVLGPGPWAAPPDRRR